VPPAESWRRLIGLPRSAHGTVIAHAGAGFLAIGVVAMSAYHSERILVMKPGESTEFAGYRLTFKGVAPRRGPNYREDIGLFTVMRGENPVTELRPSKRLYDAPPQPTTEAGIHAAWSGDLYTVIGDAQTGGGYAVRLYFNPLVRLIWIGALIMFLGGALSLSDRRLRVGAPRKATPVSAALPAE
jgi:cytochrome c-type biogenesis protein CcmF